MMDLGLSEDLVEVREKIRKFVEEKVEPIDSVDPTSVDPTFAV